MYDEQLQSLLFQVPAGELEPQAASEQEPNVSPPSLAPPRTPLGQPWSGRPEPDGMPPMQGIFLAVLLSAIFWLAVFAIVARTLM